MPIYVGYTQKRRIVKLLDAGKNQILLCPESFIELTARISDYTNTKNYTFDWVQTKGPEAILTKVDDFTSTYVFSDTVDKTFTFYIDKGTPQEQFADVEIFYTPTSIQQPSVASSELGGNFNLVIPNKTETETLYFAPSDTTFSWNVDTQKAVQINFTDVEDSFSPNKVVKYEVLTSEEYTTEPNEVFLSYEKGNYPNILVLPDGIYRFRVYYIVKGLKKVVTSKVFVSNSRKKEKNYSINTQYGITHADSKLLNLVKYFTTRKVYTDVFSTDILANHNLNSTVRYTPKLINYISNPELNTYHNLNVIVGLNLYNIQRADPSNIGNN